MAAALFVQQHTATHCNTLQHIEPCLPPRWLQRSVCLEAATHCVALHHTATHCNILRHTVTHCNTLQQVYLRDGCSALCVASVGAGEKKIHLKSQLNSQKNLHVNSIVFVYSSLKLMRMFTCFPANRPLSGITCPFHTLQLQHTAICCKCCNTLQHAATHCNTLQHTEFVPASQQPSTCQRQHAVFKHCNCNTLKQAANATRCNTLQHAATHRICTCFPATMRQPATTCHSRAHFQPDTNSQKSARNSITSIKLLYSSLLRISIKG